MKKILHLIDGLDYGGAERQLILNLSKLDRQAFENYVCCVGREGALADQVAGLGIGLFSLQASGKPGWPGATIRLQRLVRSLKIDLIHTSLFQSDIVGGVAGRLCSVPVVSTLCNIGDEPERLIDNPNLNWLKLTAATKLRGWGLRHLHRHSVAISEAVKCSAMRSYGIPESKLTVIYRALPNSWMANGTSPGWEQLGRDLNLENAYPVLINVARLVPQKGQRHLIEAMPALTARFPEVRLLIAGEGPLAGSLAELSRQLGVDRHITFLGRRNDIRDLLAISDIFVFPSLFEGLGGALLEAAGMGKPCVASGVGPVPEVVEGGSSGLLVPPRSPGALAEAITRLADDRHLAIAMGRRARQIAQEKFVIDRTIQQLEAVYDQVLYDGLSAGVKAQPAQSDVKQ